MMLRSRIWSLLATDRPGRRAPQRGVPPRLEQLGERALPNAASSFQHLTSDIQSDLANVQSQIQSVTSALGTNANQTVMSDLSTLGTKATAVVNDLTTGMSPATDLSALTGAATQFRNDLTGDLGKAVQHQIDNFGHAVTDLAKDVNEVVNRVGGELNRVGGDLTSDMAAVQNDVQRLTAALGNNASSAVTTALSGVTTALTNVSNDLTSGLPSATDLSALNTAEQQLASAIGNAGKTVDRYVKDLRADVRDVVQDFGQASKLVDQRVSRLQSDLTKLTDALGSNASASADLRVLSDAVGKVSADISGGMAAGAHVSAAISAGNMLSTDLGVNINPGVQNQITRLNNDLMGLGNFLGGIQV